MVRTSQKCLQCGGVFPADEQCRDRFDLCLAMEYENPSTYGVVHHLTVACYMLQHNAYSRNAWLAARKMIVQFIEEGITPEKMRRQNDSRFDSGYRKWSVTKGQKLSEFNTIIWSRTIADVRLDNPQTYVADVELWAKSIIADTQSLIQELKAV